MARVLLVPSSRAFPVVHDCDVREAIAVTMRLEQQPMFLQCLQERSSVRDSAVVSWAGTQQLEISPFLETGFDKLPQQPRKSFIRADRALQFSLAPGPLTEYVQYGVEGGRRPGLLKQAVHPRTVEHDQPLPRVTALANNLHHQGGKQRQYRARVLLTAKPVGGLLDDVIDLTSL